MKKIKALYIGMAMTAAAAALTGCQADMDAPALEEPKATMTPNTTLAEFKAAFENMTVLCPMKDEDTKTPYIIHGRVVSSDATGNIYKSIVIQDETAALTLSVNQGSTYTDYRLGQEIVVNATGIYTGYFNGLQQLGWYDEYNGSASMTFMPWDIFLGHTEKNGFPNDDVVLVDQAGPWPSENPYCIVTSFTALPSSGAEFRNMQSQLVEFRNVHFEEGGKETYAPYQESVNRTLVDASGATMTVRTSGYSNFYNELIPEGTGTVRGILSYYSDAWQLLLRGLDDVMITAKGQKNDPYTVAEAIEAQGQGAFGWVKGYIVGSVKAGVNDVESNEDVIFGKDAEMDNNILVAADPNETNWVNCIAVELPQGSAFRASVNLVDNPDVLGQAILVSGNLTTFLGMPGLTGNGGTADDVEVEGVTIGGNTGGGDTSGIPDGTGTKDAPYSAGQVSAMSTSNNVVLYSGVWVEGYIVGYVDTGIQTYATAESSKFTAPATLATNLLLAQTPTETDFNKCISVNLPSGSTYRSALNLMDNPGNLGKLLKIQGDVTHYVGLSGVKSPSAYEFVDGGSTTPDTPSTGTETTIYSGLGTDLTSIPSDWTIDNVLMPQGINGTEIWTWQTYNGKGYLNATGQYATTDGLSYAISPVIDLSGYKTVSASFRHAAKFQTTIKELCGFAVRESGSTTWTEITIPTWPGTDNWTFVSSGDMDLSAFAGKKVQVAFKYGCSAKGGDKWEINDIKVVGTK